ncbi:MAG: hypothetical protein JO001_28895 [Alphaproteobacteria bacterium]|nr:hypothetical protein [Alphaproteobacteria bacterium]
MTVEDRQALLQYLITGGTRAKGAHPLNEGGLLNLLSHIELGNDPAAKDLVAEAVALQCERDPDNPSEHTRLQIKRLIIKRLIEWHAAKRKSAEPKAAMWSPDMDEPGHPRHPLVVHDQSESRNRPIYTIPHSPIADVMLRFASRHDQELTTYIEGEHRVQGVADALEESRNAYYKFDNWAAWVDAGLYSDSLLKLTQPIHQVIELLEDSVNYQRLAALLIDEANHSVTADALGMVGDAYGFRELGSDGDEDIREFIADLTGKLQRVSRVIQSRPKQRRAVTPPDLLQAVKPLVELWERCRGRQFQERASMRRFVNDAMALVDPRRAPAHVENALDTLARLSLPGRANKRALHEPKTRSLRKQKNETNQ